MARFSPSDAAIEGFRLIGARWRLLVGWALFNLMALIGLCVLMFVLLFAIVPFAGSREAAGASGALVGGLVIGLGELFVQVILICGLFRLELRPEEPGFLHLRIGGDELRVLGSILLVVAAALPLAALAVLITAASARVSPWLAVPVAIAVAAAFYGTVLRLGLTPPIAFAERRISLSESWRRTRGHAWSLVGMALLLLCLMMLAASLIWFALFLISGFATGFADLGLRGQEAFAAHPGRYLLQLGAELLLAPLWLVVGQAPWVSAYRALSSPQRD